jgi:hypothetical protein
MNRLPARTGLEWLKQGFALFRRQPGVLTMIVFANLLLTILLSALPLLGVILFFVFIPCFIMAIQQACLLIDEGQRVRPDVLLTGFRKGTLGPLSKLGAVYLAAFVLLMLAVSPWIDVESVQQAQKLMQAKQPFEIDKGTQMAVLTFSFLFGLTMLALSFAPALVCWKKMQTFKAMFYSVFAILGSLRAMLVMVFAWLAIYWTLLAIVGVLLGRSQLVFVVFMWMNLISGLILQCAIYAAYKQIMGAPDLKPDPAP